VRQRPARVGGSLRRPVRREATCRAEPDENAKIAGVQPCDDAVAKDLGRLGVGDRGAAEQDSDGKDLGQVAEPRADTGEKRLGVVRLALADRPHLDDVGAALPADAAAAARKRRADRACGSGAGAAGADRIPRARARDRGLDGVARRSGPPTGPPSAGALPRYGVQVPGGRHGVSEKRADAAGAGRGGRAGAGFSAMGVVYGARGHPDRDHRVRLRSAAVAEGALRRRLAATSSGARAFGQLPTPPRSAAPGARPG
jgi:hypothetical protein